MRVDAQRNYEHLLDIGRVVVAEQGAEASLRDVARRAGVGLGTLYRHFPSREALLEALLRASFDKLAAQAAELEVASSPVDALIFWLRDCVAFSHTYRGVTGMMMAAIENTESALHASCVTMRAAGTQLLTRAQAAGAARPDLDGTDLFALIAALAWLGDQPSSASRADHHFDIIARAILPDRASGDSHSESA
jgi:AcrR family transcriptional regulator